jgi:hypothetical protein
MEVLLSYSMKKFLILLLSLIVAQTSLAQLHTTRRALIEEFTSSSSDACAMSDFVIDQFEGEAPGHFCIVKWYLPYGTKGGTNQFYNDYPLSSDRSQGYYANDTVPRIFLNGGTSFDPTGLPLDSLRARVNPEYSKTSPFILDITQQTVGDSVIALITIRQLDTTIDLTKLSIGVIITERYNQLFPDINHFPYHTNIVRTVLPSLDPKAGAIRDAIPFYIAMQGKTVQTFRFAAKLGADWDQYGLVSVGVIQNNLTKEVLQCNWTVPEVSFDRPTTSTFIFADGATPCQFTLHNMSDANITITPQLSDNAPSDWHLELSGMPSSPNFVLGAHSSVTGTFISGAFGPFRGSGEFTLLLRVNPGLVVANISGNLVGNDSRDLIIKNWASSVYQVDPDIVTWKQFGLDAAICNDDAIGDLFNNNLLRFRRVYVQRSNYGDSTGLESIKEYMASGGRMIFNSKSVLKYFSNSIIDTTVNKYAVKFEKIFQTIPTGLGLTNWTKGNVVPGNVFTDTLPTPFTILGQPVQPLVSTDTFSKALVKEQGGNIVATSIESGIGKIAYLTFPLSDIQNPNTVSLMTGEILKWFESPVSDVRSSVSEEFSAAIYPNPGFGSEKITYTLAKPSQIKIDIYNSLGENLRSLINTNEEAGNHEHTFDLSELPSGNYFFRIEFDGKSILKSVELIH